MKPLTYTNSAALIELTIDMVHQALRFCAENGRAHDAAVQDDTQPGLRIEQFTLQRSISVPRAAASARPCQPTGLQVCLPNAFKFDAQHIVSLNPCKRNAVLHCCLV